MVAMTQCKMKDGGREGRGREGERKEGGSKEEVKEGREGGRKRVEIEQLASTANWIYIYQVWKQESRFWRKLPKPCYRIKTRLPFTCPGDAGRVTQTPFNRLLYSRSSFSLSGKPVMSLEHGLHCAMKICCCFSQGSPLCFPPPFGKLTEGKENALMMCQL